MDTIRTLGDRYEIESALGHGGMATVYRGRDRVLGRPVAIKVLAERYSGDEKFVTRFRREARAAAGLNHTNIVSVFDTGDTDGRHYIVMEMVEGETLADLLRREGPLSPDRAARIAGTVARALEAAHEKGLIHRDVKPGNVMLTRDGDVKVMDFGIARAATDDTLTQTGMVLGTASYLSPEQSRGEPVNHRSDVYSLGCVLYEMLTGRPPFEGGTPVGVAYKHVHERPDPPSSVNPAVPPEVEAVVMRALEKDPDARYPSADAFREALTSTVASESTEPLVESTAVLPRSDAAPTQPLSHRRPPRRWVAAAVLAALVLIAGTLAVVLAGDEGRDQPRDRRGGATGSTPSPASLVEEAYLSLNALVDENAALLPPDAAQGIVSEATLAVEAYNAGDIDGALQHLDVADAVIEAAVVEGTTPEEAILSLHEGVDLVRSTMLADVPTVADGKDEEDVQPVEDHGPGNSENAPGHTKHKGKTKH
jgi:eukaryotic-like serine/threonine-protein kinase